MKSVQQHFNESYKMTYLPTSKLDFVIYSKKLRRYLLREVARPLSILDIGCGSGEALLALNKNRTSRLTGIEMSSVAAEIAKQLLPQATIYQGNMENINLSDKFDLVLSTMVLEHVEDEDAFFKKMKSFCKPGSKVLLTTVFRKKFRIYYIRNSNGEIVLEKTHVREYENKDDLLKFFKKYNFTIQDVAIVPIRYPFVDLLYNIANKLGVSSFRGFAQTRLGHLLRKCIRVPIIGYYSIEVLAISN